MAGNTREEHVKECPAFGWDKASGQGGYDPTTGECGVCEAQDPAMAAACKAEFEWGQAAAAAAKEAKQETAPAKAAKAPKVAEMSKAEKTPAPAQTAAAPQVLQEEQEKPLKTKTSVMRVLVGIIKENKPLTRKEIVAELSSRSGCSEATANTHVSMGLGFALKFGVVKKEDGKLKLA